MPSYVNELSRRVEPPFAKVAMGLELIVLVPVKLLVPVSVAKLAVLGITLFTNAVVAIDVSLSVVAGVGACGLPVKIGLANGANP